MSLNGSTAAENGVSSLLSVAKIWCQLPPAHLHTRRPQTSGSLAGHWLMGSAPNMAKRFNLRAKRVTVFGNHQIVSSSVKRRSGTVIVSADFTHLSWQSLRVRRRKIACWGKAIAERLWICCLFSTIFLLQLAWFLCRLYTKRTRESIVGRLPRGLSVAGIHPDTAGHTLWCCDILQWGLRIQMRQVNKFKSFN